MAKFIALFIISITACAATPTDAVVTTQMASAIDAKFLWDAAQTLLIAVIGIMNWLNSRQQATRGAINRLETNVDARIDALKNQLDMRNDDLNTRLVRVEQTQEVAPTHDDLGKIYDEIRALSSQLTSGVLGLSTAVAGLDATLKGVEKQVSRMDAVWRNDK